MMRCKPDNLIMRETLNYVVLGIRYWWLSENEGFSKAQIPLIEYCRLKNEDLRSAFGEINFQKKT